MIKTLERLCSKSNITGVRGVHILRAWAVSYNQFIRVRQWGEYFTSLCKSSTLKREKKAFNEVTQQKVKTNCTLSKYFFFLVYQNQLLLLVEYLAILSSVFYLYLFNEFLLESHIIYFRTSFSKNGIIFEENLH